MPPSGSPSEDSSEGLDARSGVSGDLFAAYAARIAEMRAGFETTGDGLAAIEARSAAVDALLRALWLRESGPGGALGSRLCLMALGGFGRRQLFPFSDIDLLFCADKTSATDRAKDGVRRISQALWDCGLKVAPITRALSDIERFKASDPEGSLALLDIRLVAGAELTFDELQYKLFDRRSERDARALAANAADLTRRRHARFGNTLFHLEPNIKDAPGGLRDLHVCGWLAQLAGAQPEASENTPFREATAFLTATRVFLHLLHGRDDNTLDWHMQHEAAREAVGLGWSRSAARPLPDPAYWMRAYFRHARAVERALARALERAGQQPKPPTTAMRTKAPPNSGIFTRNGELDLKQPNPELDPAHDPDIVLGAFGLMAESGITLVPEAEERIAAAIPALSAGIEDGPRLWARLRGILTGPHAAAALREMHALGVLELLLPEFHGIDALVVRDAYHRYTVDEHTFVLLEVLHGLGLDPPPGAPEWRLRFRLMLRELPFPELLYLAALLHDTGKGRTATNHAVASAALATEVCTRLELGPFETSRVVRLIECHLEMSAALRRDIFDTESVRVFAEKVGSHDLLRMLTLFTYADISAVHPDALTPWKAENLWRLSMAAANQLDRNIDDERVHTGDAAGRAVEQVMRALGPSVLGRSAPDRTQLAKFLEGLPERYLRTRSPETVRQHMLAAAAVPEARVLLGQHGTVGEVTVVGRERPQLFADLAAGLASWGLDVLTAEAFSNASGTVVDSFRFTDPYRTLELNPEERERFTAELEAVATRPTPSPAPESNRRTRRTRPRRVIETRIDIDHLASFHSTLLQIVAQDIPGLLRTAALALSAFGCSIEVALIDTEGEMAIDVFYITRGGEKLTPAEAESLRSELLSAIANNAS